MPATTHSPFTHMALRNLRLLSRNSDVLWQVNVEERSKRPSDDICWWLSRSDLGKRATRFELEA